MKKILFGGSLLMLGMTASAQIKQGTVIYERSAQMRMNINAGGGAAPETVQNRTDKFELSFANNKTLWKQAEKENEEADMAGQGGTVVRMIVGGSDDVLYTDLDAKRSTGLRIFFEKKFIVDDSINVLKWKLGEETKTILGHVCRKATTTNISSRMVMNINNGEMEKKEVADTAMITAWFATDIPVSAGPDNYQGQLPGLILALDVNNGRFVFVATAISEKVNLSDIKQPTGKKHYTSAEFRTEREKMMKEMQENNRGGNMQIRMN